MTNNTSTTPATRRFVINLDGVFNTAKDFPNLRAAKKFVEAKAPMKSGWEGEWGNDPEYAAPNTWYYDVYNSRGTFQYTVWLGRPTTPRKPSTTGKKVAAKKAVAKKNTASKPVAVAKKRSTRKTTSRTTGNEADRKVKQGSVKIDRNAPKGKRITVTSRKG